MSLKKKKKKKERKEKADTKNSITTQRRSCRRPLLARRLFVWVGAARTGHPVSTPGKVLGFAPPRRVSLRRRGLAAPRPRCGGGGRGGRCAAAGASAPCPACRGNDHLRLCWIFINLLIYSMQRYPAHSGDEDGSYATLCRFSSISPKNQNKAKKKNRTRLPSPPDLRNKPLLQPKINLIFFFL